MKVCKRCLIEQPLTEFYKHQMMADGHLNFCKSCKRKQAIENRNKNIEYYRAYDKARANEPQRIQARKDFRESEAGRNAQNKEKNI